MRLITALLYLASFMCLIGFAIFSKEITGYGVPLSIGLFFGLLLVGLVTDIRYVRNYKGDPWDLI